MLDLKRTLRRAVSVQALVVLASAAALTSARAGPESAAIGLWASPSQGWVVETKPCGSGICGFLVSFLKGKSSERIAKDSHNPDPSKRNAPLCGLKLLGGFTPSEQVPEKWEKGWVYDPETGSTYTGAAQIIDTDTIRVRGYVIIPLFGRTITLFRAVGAVERCSASLQDASVLSAPPRASAQDLSEAHKQH